MDLQALIAQWLADKHPDVTIDRSVMFMSIETRYIPTKYEGDVWYVGRIEEDKVSLFNPAKNKFGPSLMAGLPTFFEQLDAVISFYRTYAP